MFNRSRNILIFSDPVRKMSVTLYKEDWTDLVNQLKKKLALIIDNNNKYEWASNINLTHQLCSQKYRKVVRSGQLFPPLVACENVKRMIKASEKNSFITLFQKGTSNHRARNLKKVYIQAKMNPARKKFSYKVIITVNCHY